MLQFQSAFGAMALLGIAWMLSEDRFKVSWRRVVASLVLTLLLALLFTKVSAVRAVILPLNDAVDAISAAARAGSSFVFGYLGGAPLPFEPKFPGSDFVLAFQALPIVLVMSVITSLLFYWKILPSIVRGFSRLLERTLGIGGAVGLSAAANIFLGMVEAPLFIKPYLERLTRGELFMVMTGGMASIAGSVLVLYATVLKPIIPDVAGHLIIASVLSAPAAILISELMVPDAVRNKTESLYADPGRGAASSMDAIVRGTSIGLELFLNIVAMLLVLVALVHLGNAVLGLLPDIGGAPLTLQRLLGIAMAPVCWPLGIPWAEAATAGSLMGLKTILNEFIAYIELSKTPADALSERSRLIMLYAMCGFANFGSLGIMIAGLTVMAPKRRDEIIALGPRTIISGTLTTCLIGATVGILH